MVAKNESVVEPHVIGENVYDEMNKLVNNNFQVVVNKDGSLREMYRSNLSQTRNFCNFPDNEALEIIENTKDPLFVLRNFTGGDIVHI